MAQEVLVEESISTENILNQKEVISIGSKQGDRGEIKIKEVKNVNL